ncbi:MAG: hypothetical protein M3R35_05405 [Candidatus Eremiobacteraeota bacterium]|nr:hypothetical protein [Candidatus Eremiobacteraeota bacterium]
MKSRSLVRIALAAFVAVAVLPHSAVAQGTEPPPVAINACGPLLQNNTTAANNPVNTLFGIPVTSTSGGMQIQFTNQTSKTADLINFAVDSNGTSFVIRDVGTFSPNIEITHRYRNGEGQAFVLPQFIAPKITCHVQSVRFTDGTSWRRGQTTAPVQMAPGSNPLSVNPSNVQIDADADSRLFLVTSSDHQAAFSERSTCTGIASITLAVTGEAAATYSVKPLSAGSCTATITDEIGHTLDVPITVH